MERNQMPKGGIQKLRDFVTGELGISDPEFNGYGNMIENAVTVLQRTGKIQWEPPPDPVLSVTAEELRKAADQLEAYATLVTAGADISDRSAKISVHGRVLGYVWWAAERVLLAIDATDPTIDWISHCRFRELNPGDYFEAEDDD